MTSTTKRRRFQPPITTFFTALHDDTTDFSPTGLISSPSTLSHANDSLPHSIQSSLLSVGMRVRKSVPEGYKTTSKPPSTIYPTYSRSSLTETITSIQTPDYTTSSTGFAELAPYCGVLKTGNLAVQALPNAQLQNYPGLAMAVDDQPDSLPSSQESYTSTASLPTRPQQSSGKNKRSLATDQYHESSEIDDADEPFSPSLQAINRLTRVCFPISHTRMPDLNSVSCPMAWSNRTIAVPKSRRKKFVWNGGLDEQENRHVGWGGGERSDFGEAAFLREREEVEGDVVMGG